MSQADGFVGRWSRLKQQASNDSAEALLPGAMAADATVVDGSLPKVSPEQALENPLELTVDKYASEMGEAVEVESELTDADMPALETLNEDSDFSGFLSSKVSEALRRQALKKLFHLPEFNIRDGLNEYDEDYSKFIPLGDTVTYQMKQWLERQKQEFEQALSDDEAAAQAVSSPAESAVQSETESLQIDEQDDDDDLGSCE